MSIIFHLSVAIESPASMGSGSASSGVEGSFSELSVASESSMEEVSCTPLSDFVSTWVEQPIKMLLMDAIEANAAPEIKNLRVILLMIFLSKEDGFETLWPQLKGI